jgi:hypothetical protein
MSTWREMLEEAMKDRGELFTDLVSSTLSDAEMDKEFDSGYGSANGEPFTAWSENTVYFPVCYDGQEWVGFVSRNPDGKPTWHQGGG